MKIIDDCRKRFGSRLRSLRKERRKTQKEVAAAIDVSPQVISCYEKGEYLPSAVHCMRLVNYFGISFDELL
ncbi:MAG: helix-turn-helix domain-containing protein [Solobacterium sp.]|nr:helix-turn-helix domain-containing protein [Solobacterium sp.]